MATSHFALLCLPALLAAGLLSGCGDDPDDAANEDRTVASLPQPRQTSGAVTGMPAKPGPGDVPLAGQAPPPALLPADDRFGLPPLEDNPETGLAQQPANGGEPAPADAAGVLQRYYAAINSRDFAQAFSAWSDGGRSSGLTPEQFAAAFEDVVGIEFTAGDPGPVEGAAGSRYVEIPVTVATRMRDGSVRRQAGRYVLRRAMVDGATPEQRSWHIASADLRDAAQ